LRSNAARRPPEFSPKGCSIFVEAAALLVVQRSMKDILSSRLAATANL
jgi:hypothetical protein